MRYRYKLATWIERRFNKPLKPSRFVNDTVPFNGYY